MLVVKVHTHDGKTVCYWKRSSLLWDLDKIMGYIHCCSGLRKSKSYSVSPDEDYFLVQMDYLEKCPICGHTVVQLTRIDKENNVSTYRKINQKAKKLFDKLKSSILFERSAETAIYKTASSFYLYYNEYGVKKKCYSNLSSLKMGLFENKELIKEENILREDFLIS